MGILFRAAHSEDAAAVASIYAPYCTSTTVSFETLAPSPDEMQQRIEQVLCRYPWIVCEVDGAVGGYAYASAHHPRAAYRWTVDTAIYLAPWLQRRQAGRALYTSVLATLRAQGFVKALAGIAVPNPTSQRFHRALGFRLVARFPEVGFKHGRWLGVEWWQFDLHPPGKSPVEPTPFSTLDPRKFAAAIREGVAILEEK